MPLDEGRHRAPDPGSGRAEQLLPAEICVARQVAAEAAADRVALVLFSGPENRAVVRGSDALLVAVGDMAETVGEGPAYDVLTTGALVAVEDAQTSGARWPLLTTAFRLPDELRSLLLLPLRERGSSDEAPDVFGVLALSRDRVAPFTPTQTTAALRGARLLAAMVMERALHEDQARADDDLDALLDPRVDVVPHAVGVLADRRAMGTDEAHRELQVAAFAAGRTLHEVAERLVHDEP